MECQTEVDDESGLVDVPVAVCVSPFDDSVSPAFEEVFDQVCITTLFEEIGVEEIVGDCKGSGDVFVYDFECGQANNSGFAVIFNGFGIATMVHSVYISPEDICCEFCIGFVVCDPVEKGRVCSQFHNVLVNALDNLPGF